MSAPEILIVDDDPVWRSSLRRLLRDEGYQVEAYHDAASLLTRRPPDFPCCLLLDVMLPDGSGLELLQRVQRWPLPPAVVLMSGLDSVPVAVEGMRRGALDFLAKPVHAHDLLLAVARAVDTARRLSSVRRHEDDVRRRLTALTAREREVFALVTQGLLNKQVAARLGTTEKTIKVHRSRVMHKLGAGSLAELVRMADRLLGPPPTAPPPAGPGRRPLPPRQPPPP